ncbi:protein kinase domain-containing protein [Egbenema bharatensis]|uniref:protein kinase domain-containing protein n=1 Tax=Egbenema bharatensis TaxID=3463334 RepID=UPI003A8949CE
MSYCLNPTCRKPQNPNNARFCQTCGTRLLLDNRYRAIKLIGQGGFGRTFLAVDEASDRIINERAASAPCVIKQLFSRDRQISPEKAIALFHQEAMGLAQLGEHPQIPALFAHFEVDGTQYLIQEYIDGINLEEILAAEGTFNEFQVRDLLADLLPVVRFIHSFQLIHRDIKPENIIRPRGGGPLVLVDFGASKSATDTALARTGTVIGSAGYVAPEQAMGRAEFASDLYSLGVTCIHLMTGLHPFDLYSISEDRWVWSQYLPPATKGRISGRLRRVLDKLLQKPTNQRYRNATEVLLDLGLESKTGSLPGAAAAKPPDRQRNQSRSPQSGQSAVEEMHWRCLRSLTGHEGGVTALALSPGGRILVSGSGDKSIKFWSMETGRLLHTIPGRSLWGGTGHTERISSLAFSPDGETLASGSDDGTVKWWDLDTTQLIYTLPNHGWGISTLRFSPDGFSLVYGSRDGFVQMWDLETERIFRTFNQHQAQISDLQFDTDGRTLISSSYDKTICLWDARSAKLINCLTAHPDRISALALTPDRRLLISASWDKTVKLWDLEFATQRKVIAAHRKPVTCLAMHPSGQFFASGSEDSYIKLWDLETGDRLCSLRGFWGINAIGFSQDGNYLVSGSADGLVKVWQRLEK